MIMRYAHDGPWLDARLDYLSLNSACRGRPDIPRSIMTLAALASGGRFSIGFRMILDSTVSISGEL